MEKHPEFINLHYKGTLDDFKISIPYNPPRIPEEEILNEELYDKLAKILNLNIVAGKNPSDYITIVINKALAYNKMIVPLNKGYFIDFYYNNDTSEKLNHFKKEHNLEQTTMTGGVRRRRSSKKSSKKTSKRNSKKSSKTMKGGAKRKTSKKSSKTRARK